MILEVLLLFLTSPNSYVFLVYYYKVILSGSFRKRPFLDSILPSVSGSYIDNITLCEKGSKNSFGSTKASYSALSFLIACLYRESVLRTDLSKLLGSTSNSTFYISS